VTVFTGESDQDVQCGWRKRKKLACISHTRKPLYRDPSDMSTSITLREAHW
jgi:hypothetical protein